MNRVVITGMGIVSPIGNDLSAAWENVKAGKHGISFIEKFDISNSDVKVAAQVKDFDPLKALIKRN